jgi:O-antigen/teichoic acid export membrane protein
MGSIAKRRLFKSTLANYFGAAVLAALPIVTIPTYISSLGNLQWGLVGFMGTLQALLIVADAGFSQVLIREFAVRLSAGAAGAQRAAALLRSCERFYFLLLCVVLATAVVLSRVVADHWLKLPAGSRNLGAIAVVGGGLLCLLYVPGSLYRGVAMAGEEQVRFNMIVAAGAILRFGGGAVVVSRWPHLEVYLVWFVAMLGIEVTARSILAWHVVGGRATASYSRGELRQLIAGMGAWTIAAVIGAITIQMDKAILSRTIPIAALAAYYIASQVAMGTLQVFSPMITAMLPALLRPAENRQQRSRDQLRLFSVILVLGMALIGAVWLVGRKLLGLWIGNQRAAEVAPILSVLLVGVCCNALCNVGYINWLARDRRMKVLVVNIVALSMVIALTLILVPKIGLKGAAIAWSAAQLCIFIMSLDWISDVVNGR